MKTQTKRQNPPTVAMRLNKADKAALKTLSVRLGISQTEAVRRAVAFSLATMPKTAIQ